MSRNALASTKVVSNRLRVDESVSDEALLEAYRDFGDRQAFDSLVHRYERELYSYLRRYLGDATAADDVFQASFLQVHLRCQQFESGRRFKPWLYAIATNAAIDATRRSRRHRMVSLNQRNDSEQDELSSLVELLVSRESSPSSRLEEEEHRQWIRQAVANLPDSLRSVVTLVYYQGLKYREVGESLNVPVGTVKSRMHAALLKLNQAWDARNSSATEI